jgi:hypothetical protein
MPYTIGNIYNNTLQEIWLSHSAEQVRQSVSDGDFTYCNWACSALLNLPLRPSQLPVVNPFPKIIKIDLDRSCNLKCPSCREHVIIEKNSARIDKQIEDGSLFVESEGLKKVAIPNLHPIDAIDWCAKRCLDKNESPSFLFFENNKGYNFVSLSTLLSISPVASLNFTPKNINLGDKTEETQFLGIKDFKVLSQFDFLKSVQNGVYAGKFIGFDPITRTIAQREITFDDHYYTSEHGNKVPNLAVVENVKGLNNTQMFDAKQSVYVFGYYRKENDFINQKDPESLNYVDDPYKYIFQRRAIVQNLMTQRVQIVLPGNFQITSGVNVKLLVPKIGQYLKNEDNLDKSLYGNHLVIATHHCIQPNKHEVVIEAVSDSSNREYGILTSKPIQDSAYYA